MTDFRFFHGLAWGLFFSAVLWLCGGLSVWAWACVTLTGSR